MIEWPMLVTGDAALNGLRLLGQTNYDQFSETQGWNVRVIVESRQNLAPRLYEYGRLDVHRQCSKAMLTPPLFSLTKAINDP